MLTPAFAALYKATAAAGGGVSFAAVSRRPELEYWKAINSVAPPKDPQVLFLLMAEYSNAQLQGEGAEFLSARLKEFGPRLTDSEKALYLSAVGLLRAQHASSVPLIHRVGYVKETVGILESRRVRVSSYPGNPLGPKYHGVRYEPQRSSGHSSGLGWNRHNDSGCGNHTGAPRCVGRSHARFA